MKIGSYELSLDGKGNITMNGATLFLVIAVSIAGNNKLNTLATKEDLEAHAALPMHSGAITALAESGQEVDRLALIILRGQIVSYVSRICSTPDSPHVDTWRSELNALLADYRELAGQPYPQNQLECVQTQGGL